MERRVFDEAAVTTDRDVRLTAGQLVYLARIARRRKNELGKKIARADENRRAGAKIQHGTLERHMDELNELAHAIEALDVARRQIDQQIARRLELERELRQESEQRAPSWSSGELETLRSAREEG